MIGLATEKMSWTNVYGSKCPTRQRLNEYTTLSMTLTVFFLVSECVCVALCLKSIEKCDWVWFPKSPLLHQLNKWDDFQIFQVCLNWAHKKTRVKYFSDGIFNLFHSANLPLELAHWIILAAAMTTIFFLCVCHSHRFYCIITSYQICRVDDSKFWMCGWLNKIQRFEDEPKIENSD